MNKDSMKPKDIKSFNFAYNNKESGEKRNVNLGYDRLGRLVTFKNDQELENFAYDLIHHVGVKSWRKETDVKGGNATWEMYLGGKDRTGVTFSGNAPYPAKDFEDKVDRWGILMQLLDIIEEKEKELLKETEEKKEIKNESIPS